MTATLAIYDTMQIISCPVATYCVGLAASGGAVLLAGGTSGKRFALRLGCWATRTDWEIGLRS